jgi:hypothetical protein
MIMGASSNGWLSVGGAIAWIVLDRVATVFPLRCQATCSKSFILPTTSFISARFPKGTSAVIQPS